MKNITFTANAVLIEKARKKAKDEKTSLNVKFNEWLNNYINEHNAPEDLASYWSRYENIDLTGGGKLSRAKRNER